MPLDSRMHPGVLYGVRLCRKIVSSIKNVKDLALAEIEFNKRQQGHKPDVLSIRVLTSLELCCDGPARGEIRCSWEDDVRPLCFHFQLAPIEIDTPRCFKGNSTRKYDSISLATARYWLQFQEMAP